MKIVVCVKKVPDTATKLKVAQSGQQIDTSDIEYVISPYDEYAVEHAVQIKEKNQSVEVVVVSLGTSDSEKIMRTCLAMGADRGILLENEQDQMDAFVVAKALADAIREESPDLVLFGIKAVDDDNAQVGGMVATLLEMPFVDGAITLELGDGTIKATCESDGGQQTLQTPLPCALAINKGGVEPRICSLINIRKARKKELKKVAPELSAETYKVEKMELPHERKGGRIIGEGADAVPELFRLLKEEAKVL